MEEKEERATVDLNVLSTDGVAVWLEEIFSRPGLSEHSSTFVLCMDNEKTVQGYLAHKKQRPPRTLRQAYA